MKLTLIATLCVVCIVSPKAILSQRFSLDSNLGRTITYRIKKDVDSTWKQILQIAKTYPYHYETYFGHLKKDDELGLIQINPIQGEVEKKTQIFFKISAVDRETSSILVYKSVYYTKREWAWSLHNLLGLFEFVTFAVPEPLDTPFTEEQLRAISTIIASVSK